MNKHSMQTHARGIHKPLRLSFAIAATLFAAGQLHAQSTQPASQASDHTEQAANKDNSKTTKPSKKKVVTLTSMTVNGYAASLSRAQEIKKYANTVVDAISAQDATSLPDTSVTEALKRLPGVTVSSFGVQADPDHFSIQGTDISLEGLPYTSTLINGGSVFSAGGGEGLNFSTVAPELIGTVVVSKNQTASMIDGGISGTINMNTRKPFDSDKPTTAAASIGIDWGTLAKKSTPHMSALFSHNFNTDWGRFGILGAAAYGRIAQQDNAISVVDYQQRCNGCTLPNGVVDSFPGLAAGQTAYVPVGGDLRLQNQTSERFGHDIAAQWESPDKKLRATLQWTGVSDNETTFEHTLQASTDACAFGGYTTCAIPLSGTVPTYDSNGVLTSGIITTAPSATSFTPSSYGGMQTQLDTTGYRTRYTTNDINLKLGWDVTDRLHLSGDAQYTKSRYDYRYYYIRQLTNANWAITTHGNNVPSVSLLSPNPAQTTAQYFADPANFYYAAAQDAYRNSWGNQRALRLDGTFDVNADLIDSVQFGVRYAKQSETLQNSIFNYQNISSPYVWGGWSPVITGAQTPGVTAPVSIDLPGFNTNYGVTAPYVNVNPALQFDKAVAIMRAINAQWLASAPPGSLGNPYYTNDQRVGLVPGTGYMPQEISSNSTATRAAYVQLNFGNDSSNFLSNLQISGNVGVRIVHTQNNATGYLIVPNQSLAQNGMSVAAYCALQTSGGSAAAGTFCALSPAQQQQYTRFANGAYTPITAPNSYNNILPSFNLAIGWTNNLISRFAYSKAIYRPSLQSLAAGQGVSGLLPYTPSNGLTTPTVGNAQTGTNPYLKPITSQNFDLTTEWYFANVGQLSATLFWKKLNNLIEYDTSVANVAVTNNGVTYPEIYTAGLVNLNHKANVHGVELAYQQTFSFLPGWLSGLGANANYTYIKSGGMHFGSVHYCAYGYAAATQCVNQTNLPPQELSRDSLNLGVYYGKGPLNAKVVWNWRSAFLITASEADYPFLPVMARGQGQVDASVSYALNKHMKLSLQAANILNSTFKTREIVNTEGLQVPKGFFRFDTRYDLTFTMSL
ncbi:TonB-dependent receptor [Dyella sp. A6]|uniref:TonB-dependent receptor n=1 Tax=Dyella aluminiiresistens TaxID=3069105 RepID=UPI002E79035A|nr:TonB-dependent receptor [Dyella sp. A6]